MAKNFATRGQCRHRRIGAPDAGAADDQEQIVCAAIKCRRNRSGIAARGHRRHDVGARSPRALRNQIRRHCAAGNIDDAEPRQCCGALKRLETRRGQGWRGSG